MALIPDSNLVGLPEVTKRDFETNDPSRLNRTLNLIARQIHAVQTGVPSSSTITNITQNIAASGSTSGGGTVVTTGGNTLQGTHSERLATVPSDYAQGTQYYETDRTVTYLDYSAASDTLVWQYLSGVMQASLASRPGDLGTYDAGFRFYSSDTLVNYRWTGSDWVVFDTVASIIRDTHANRTSYPATHYPANTLYEESDRTVLYISRTTSGTVTTAGTAVTWVSGDMFSATDLASGEITINGVPYTISLVNSPVSITITATAGVQTGVAYSTAILQWTYLSGEYKDSTASMPSLGANDIGFQFFDTTFWRLFEWATTGGAPSAASPGWKRGAGELPTATVQILPFGGGQMTTGWTLCNGGIGTVTQDDSTILSLTKPNMIGAYPKGGTTGTYSPTQVAAVTPTLSGSTDTGFANIPPTNTGSSLANVTSSTTAVQSGAGTTVVSSIGQSGHIHSESVTDSGHTHGLSAATVSIAGGDPIANVVVPYYMKR